MHDCVMDSPRYAEFHMVGAGVSAPLIRDRRHPIVEIHLSYRKFKSPDQTVRSDFCLEAPE